MNEECRTAGNQSSPLQSHSPTKRVYIVSVLIIARDTNKAGILRITGEAEVLKQISAKLKI